MDISETYIKMRLAAIPDLGMGIPIESPCNLIANDVWVDSKGDWYYATMDRVVQLERQDQLQKMVGLSKLEKQWLDSGVETIESLEPHLAESRLNRFYEFVMIGECKITTRLSEYCLQFTSMEQLWFAFVQRELRNKVWIGEDWIDGN